MLSKNAHSLTSTLTDSFYKERGLSALHKIFVRKATVLKYRDRLKKKKKSLSWTNLEIIRHVYSIWINKHAYNVWLHGRDYCNN